MLALRQDCADCELRCVCFYTEEVIISGDGQDRSSSDKSLDSFKRFILFGFPDPRVVSSEPGERTSDARITLNKPTVEIAKAQKRLNLSFVCQRFPVRNTGNLHRVHTDLPMSNNDTKVLGLSLIKGALVEVKV